MKKFRIQLSSDSREFEVCQDINGNDDLVSIFELHLNGRHYEYLYKNKASGIYTSTPKSLLSHNDVAELGQRVEEELNKTEKQ